MAKNDRVHFICRQCGHDSPKWLGRCPGCGEWGTLEETAPLPAATKALGLRGSTSGPALIERPRRLQDIPVAPEQRQKTGMGEFDRVLGGGIVPGSLVLIGGDPGIGKSTLLTQVAGHLAESGGKVLYVSGEESTQQIKLRTERLGVTRGDVLLHNETDVFQIAAAVSAEQPTFVIIDSIQTMAHPDVESAPGSVTQVRAATSSLAAVAKGQGVPIFLVGHVTKEGALAGPRVLEHMVDTVLTFEGDRHYAYRVLRSVKNRFGSTDEIGLFEMHEEGLAEVPNPSEMLLAERTMDATGSAVTATVEGTRPLLIEIQALVAPSYLTNPRRTVAGVDTNRVNLILAVLEKRVGLALANQDVFLKVAGGVRIDEPAADLAIAMSIASNFHEIPVDPGTVFAGEVGLGGEVRAVSQIDRRLREASRMGFTRAVIGSRSKKAVRGKTDGLEVIGVDTVRQAIEKGLVAERG